MEKYLRPSRFDVDPDSPTATKEWTHWLTTFENFVSTLDNDLVFGLEEEKEKLKAVAGNSSRPNADGRSRELFSKSFYVGSEAQGVVRLYYQSEKPLRKRQPKICHGILINWQKAVVPCSCVSYTKKDSDTRSPFNYHDKIRKHGKKKNMLGAKKVTVVDESYIRVGIMQDEHDPTRNRTNLVNVTKIRIHPKCNSFYNVNYASLDLERKIEGSRLIWVNQAVKRRLAEEIEFTAIGSAITGECFVVRWVEKKFRGVTAAERGNGAPPFEWLRSSSIDKASLSSPEQAPAFELTKDYVTFTSWDSCLSNVCPVQPNKSVNLHTNGSYCTNKIDGKRWCAQWTANAKLCGQPEGTPVFCHVRDFDGVMGLLYNTPFHCDHRSSRSGVMASFEEALDLVKYDLPLRHSSTYLHSLPSEYNDYFQDPVKFEDYLHQTDSASFKSFYVSPIIVCTIKMLVNFV